LTGEHARLSREIVALETDRHEASERSLSGQIVRRLNRLIDLDRELAARRGVAE
jgi:hypothetical protein